MYNVKGPSKIVAKSTRRGISQNIETISNHKTKPEQEDGAVVVNGPKPTFHKKSHSNHKEQEVITPQHEEIIKFINDSWTAVCSEDCSSSDGSSSPGSDTSSVLYYEEEPSAMLTDFKPFNLESWWGKRLYEYITSSVTDN